MLGDFASLDVQNTYRGSDAYVDHYIFNDFLSLHNKNTIRENFNIFIGVVN
ncbi:hypothetical protein [Piscirickettsia salmonis]|uniref:hypothetical protein n=1 Tax=Piscirickettsia salmonis TaxID=1238 RepID=UPI0012B7ABE1|nr:hypothetical protein [Piscirickettsia salmonis]